MDVVVFAVLSLVVLSWLGITTYRLFRPLGINRVWLGLLSVALFATHQIAILIDATGAETARHPVTFAETLLLVSYVFMLLSAMALRPILRTRADSRRAIERERDRLEKEHARRTAELEATNRALQQEIAERERAEAALRQAQHTLEQRVTERTAALERANEQLRHEVQERRAAELAERHQRALAEALRDTLATVNSTLDLDEVMRHILASVDLIVQYDAADIMLIDDGRAKIRYTHGYDRVEGGQDPLGLELIIAEAPHMQQMLADKTPAVIPDVRDYPEWVVFEATRWIRSHASAPIRLGEEILGFLNINSANANAFADEHGQHLQALADQAATAVRNARLVGQMRQELIQRQQAETALRWSQDQLRATLDALGDSMFVVDRSLRITLTNRAFEQMAADCNLETTPLGRSLFEVCPALPERWQDDYARVFDDGELVTSHEPITIGGLEQIAETRKIPIFEGERVVRVVTVLRDMTERHRAEESLRRHDMILDAVTFAAEEFLRSERWTAHIDAVLARLGQSIGVERTYIFENHLDAEGVFCMSQRHEWVAPGVSPEIDNPAMQGLRWQEGGFGDWEARLRRGEPVAGHVRHFPSPLRELMEPQAIQSLIIMPIFAGQAWWGFIGFDSCRTERTWTQAEIDALRLAADTIGAAIERDRTNQALRNNEARYRTLSELMSDYGYSFRLTSDGEPVLEWITEAFERITGYTAEDIAQGRWKHLLFPEDLARDQLRLERVLSGESVVSETRILRADGNVRWIRDHTRPIWDEQGHRVIGFIGAVKDITELKQAERQALQLTIERERSAILAEFIRDTSHEFANPLSVMKSDIYLLEHAGDPETQGRRVESLRKQLAHLERLVQGLLLMSQLDRGMEYEFEPTDLNYLLDILHRGQMTVAERNRQTLTLEACAEPLPIHADQRMLHTALSKLVENALTFTETGGHITLRSHRQGDQAVVEIRDTGCGIPPDELPRIFQRFYRIDRARASRGAGLGLPIAQTIIVQHSGRIEVESTPGAGSTFRVFLPIASA